MKAKVTFNICGQAWHLEFNLKWGSNSVCNNKGSGSGYWVILFQLIDTKSQLIPYFNRTQLHLFSDMWLLTKGKTASWNSLKNRNDSPWCS